jgi:malonyl-CoA O-methyltransferase
VTSLEMLSVASFAIPVAGRRLLDAACGNGRRLRDSDAALAVGIDITPEMLPNAASSEHYAAADVRALPLPAGEFDVVWCRLALGHLPDLPTAYRELARVCRMGATVIVTDFHAEAVAAGHRRTFRDTGGVVHEIVNHLHDLDAHTLAAVAAGLRVITHDDRRVGPPVREFYERANRMSDYETQIGLPLVLGIMFSRLR